MESSRWLLEHLLEAEATDRVMRSVRYQITAAKFPIHRDLAGFDFDACPVERKLVMQLADMAFTEEAHNLVLLGGAGHGQDASRDGHCHVGNHPPRQTGSVLLNRRSGQRAGNGEGLRQGRSDRCQPVAR